MERNVAAQNKGRLSNTQKQLKSLQWEHEVGSFESLLSLKVLHPATALRNFCCGFLLYALMTHLACALAWYICFHPLC